VLKFLASFTGISIAFLLIIAQLSWALYVMIKGHILMEHLLKTPTLSFLVAAIVGFIFAFYISWKAYKIREKEADSLKECIERVDAK
jgi:hypothetical protein